MQRDRAIVLVRTDARLTAQRQRCLRFDSALRQLPGAALLYCTLQHTLLDQDDIPITYFRNPSPTISPTLSPSPRLLHLKLTSPHLSYHYLISVTMSKHLDSFTHFPKLPTELQVKIWSYSCVEPYVTPRVVRVTFQPDTESFWYYFTVQPVLQVCRLSRSIAQKFYPSIVPTSTYPVYFNSAVDFLYCKALLHEWHPGFEFSPERPVLPFIDPNTNNLLLPVWQVFAFL